MMSMEEMAARLETLEKKVEELDDINRIKRLHRIYSYYVMYMMRDEIADCFADHPDVALHWLEGTWLGKEGVKRYFGVGTDRPEPSPDFIHQVMPVAGAIDVEPGGQRAKGRWYAFGGVNIPRPDRPTNGSFVGGMYEIDYIKQDGVWKFLIVKWVINYTVQCPEGSWNFPEAIGEVIKNFEAPEPDIPASMNDPRFMTGYVLPFHFNHPVTGKSACEKVKNLKLIAARNEKTGNRVKKKKTDKRGY